MNLFPKKPLISVVVPVFNVGTNLPECLDSIMRQTYSNFEVILVYDKSTDHTLNVCEEYAAKDARFSILCKEQKNGLANARNAGVELAKGELITFIDGDDTIASDYLDKMSEPMRNDDKIDVVIGGIIRVIGDRRSEMFFKGESLIMTQQEVLLDIIQGKHFGWSAWGKMYRKKLFLDFHFEDFPAAEDFDGTWKLFLQGEKFYYINYSGYCYMRRKGSMMYTIPANAYRKFLDNYCWKMESDVVIHYPFLLENMKRTFCNIFMGIIKRSLYNGGRYVDIEMAYTVFRPKMLEFLYALPGGVLRQSLVQQFDQSFSAFVELHERKLERARNCQNLYIYGAGVFGTLVAEFFMKNGISFQSFVISDEKKMDVSMEESYEVLHLKDLPSTSDILVYVALKIDNALDVMPELQKRGIQYVYF